jgi:hypothetical protein
MFGSAGIKVNPQTTVGLGARRSSGRELSAGLGNRRRGDERGVLVGGQNRFPSGLSFGGNPFVGCCAAIEADPMKTTATNDTIEAIRMGDSSAR